MHSPTIRACDERDIPAVARLLDALNRSEGYAVTTDTAPLREALFGADRDVALAALVAELGGVVVAVLLYYPGYDTLSASYGYHLADMVVDPAQRRQGIGRALMRALATQALDQGKKWVSLTALKRNDTAKHFYRALGMTEVAVDFFAIGHQALRDVRG